MSDLDLDALAKDTPDGDLAAICGRWNGRDGAAPARPRMLQMLASSMADEERVQARLEELPERLAGLLDGFLREAARARDVRAILENGASWSRQELEASLAALCREGFLFRASGRRAASFLDQSFAVPGELARCVEALRRRRESEIRTTVTLRGFLDRRFDAAARADDPERAADHARKIYRLYLLEGSIETRVNGLPEAVRAVFERAVNGFGGVMPGDEFERFIADAELDVDLDRVGRHLEHAMLGTVAPLALERFGIQPVETAVVVFGEIVLARRERAAAGDVAETDLPETLCSGVDLVTNIGRFLREVSGSNVQFTVDGNLYRASAKRIVKEFLAIPGGFMPRETQIRFIYRFCLTRRLIERSGERGLKLSETGSAFEQLSLGEKLRALLAYAVEERAPQGEHYHQVRLRRIVLRLLRGIESERWLEASGIPFLARNAYLSRVEELGVESYFKGRFRGGGYVPTESLMQVCRHLLDFVKRRLYPLGVIDLGLRDGRPVAVRLSRLGADLLGDEDAGGDDRERSSIVVNPDFEIVLFPGEDEHELVHRFDRFTRRVKTDHIYQFRIDRESLQAALGDGLTVAEIVDELNCRSRTPLPQNVIYTLRDWADQAGAPERREADA